MFDPIDLPSERYRAYRLWLRFLGFLNPSAKSGLNGVAVRVTGRAIWPVYRRRRPIRTVRDSGPFKKGSNGDQ